MAKHLNEEEMKVEEEEEERAKDGDPDEGNISKEKYLKPIGIRASSGQEKETFPAQGGKTKVQSEERAQTMHSRKAG